MKRILLSAIAVVMISTCSMAQGFHLGAKVGANLGKIDGQSFQSGFNLGYEAGAFAEIDFSKSLGIQPELLFNQTNTKVASDGAAVFNVSTGDNIHLNYLSIPVLLRINASKLVTFHVGPQYSILVNNHETTLQNAGNAFKNGDFAMVGGLQLNLSALRIYGRYTIGLSDVSDVANRDNWKSQEIQFGVGLRIL